MTLRHLLAFVAGAAALAITPNVESGVARETRKRAVPATHALHERQPASWASKWTRRDRVPGEAKLPMRIGLKQDRLDHGHDRLMDM
jgi:tripeptidyl-peptidase I